MERRRHTFLGLVQGVGFRPLVCGLASQKVLAGFVRNRGGAVEVELEGHPADLDAFVDELFSSLPPLAVVSSCTCEFLTPLGQAGFRIAPSITDPGSEPCILPDVAPCETCWKELADPHNRRYQYDFITCTDCGPRLTICRETPFDRPQTSMERFTLCADCQREYSNPYDRRFHAQTISCPACGPVLRLLGSHGQPLDSPDPVRSFADQMQSGRLGAIKGVGGFHLACLAQNEHAVAELRRRKRRETKPFALLMRDVDHARQWCCISAAEQHLLESPARPIVLLKSRPGAPPLAPSVAPRNAFLGILLPPAPLHQRLMDALAGQPLVLTSGNATSEPVAITDDEALSRLGTIADVYLTHDRPIQVRCDDSVLRVIQDRPVFIRRSRGYAPAPLPLPVACPRPILAVGGQQKSTFALGRGQQAFLSHHLGDLDHPATVEELARDVALYETLFHSPPTLIVHDLHPDYASTAYALSRAARECIHSLAVQHHHAHLAACLAEHGLHGPVLGVAWDGTGAGPDGTVWGGEFLLASLTGFQRLAHLRLVGLPGSEAAVREPWRMAASCLLDAGEDLTILNPVATPTELRMVAQMVRQRINTPLTSSAGRLLDAVAAILGVRSHSEFDGQAAMELEQLALDAPAVDLPRCDANLSLSSGSWPHVIDTRPLIRGVVDALRKGTPRDQIANGFHTSLARLIVEVCVQLLAAIGEMPPQGTLTENQPSDCERTVALSGGVFLNSLLASQVQSALEARNIRVLTHHCVPPGDGGLSLGQLAIGAARLAEMPLANADH